MSRVKNIPGWVEVSCPSCDSSSHRVFFEGRNLRYGIDITATVVECNSCSMLRTNPQPDDQTMAGLYPAGNYYTHRSVGSTDGSLTNRFGQALVGARTCLRRHMVVGQLAGARLLLERRTNLTRLTSRYSPSAFPLRAGMRLLDVGCGDGKLLSLLSSHGLDCVGVEIDPESRRIGRERGGKIEEGMDELPSVDFDRIVLSHVLEHLSNPVEMLAEVARRLSGDGLVLISVPNASSLQSEVFGSCWEGWDLPRHRWHFTKESLVEVAGRAGLEVVDLRSVEVDGFALASDAHRALHGLGAVEYAPQDYGVLEGSMRGTELVLVARQADRP